MNQQLWMRNRYEPRSKELALEPLLGGEVEERGVVDYYHCD
jgi:hypothetical protein